MASNSIQSATLLPMRPSRKPRFVLIFLIALCGLFVYSYTTRLVEKSQLESEIVAMQARIDEAEHEQDELLVMLGSINEPDYIDRIARELFGLAKPGDKVLTMIKEPATSPNGADVATVTSAISAADVRNLPVWQQWVLFFTTGSFTLSIP